MIDRTTFDHYADRGTPLGATALLERVETTLARPESVVAGRRWSGVAIAATAMIAVLLLGAVWALLRAPDADVIGEPNGLEIDWREVELDGKDSLLWDVRSGPGGFVGASVGTATPLVFSSDAARWEPLIVDDSTPLAFPLIIGGAHRWLILDPADPRGEAGVWLSNDARTWENAPIPSDMRGTLGWIYEAGDGFLAQTVDAFGDGQQFWWSADGIVWDTIDAGGELLLADSASVQAIDSTTAAVVCCDHSGLVRMWMSDGGEPWRAMTMVLPPEFDDSEIGWDLMAVERIGETWVAFGRSHRFTQGSAVSQRFHTWALGPDGRWVPADNPAGFPLELGEALVQVERTEEVLALVVNGLADGGAAWLTEDGIHWAETGVPAMAVGPSGVAIGEIDGTLTGVFPPVLRDESGTTEPPVETTTAPVPRPDLIDQTGLDFQAEVLEDGVVTEIELEEAFSGWAACMEAAGFSAEFEIDPRGGTSTEYGSPDPDAGEAEDTACRASWVNQIESGPFGPDE